MLDRWCYDMTGWFYKKHPMKVDDANLKAYPEQVAEMEKEGPSEGGFVTQTLTFVKWLFKMWKLRAKIIKTRAKILAAGQFIEYTYP